jgi:hypothetical protein
VHFIENQLFHRRVKYETTIVGGTLFRLQTMNPSRVCVAGFKFLQVHNALTGLAFEKLLGLGFPVAPLTEGSISSSQHFITYDREFFPKVFGGSGPSASSNFWTYHECRQSRVCRTSGSDIGFPSSSIGQVNSASVLRENFRQMVRRFDLPRTEALLDFIPRRHFL